MKPLGSWSVFGLAFGPWTPPPPRCGYGSCPLPAHGRWGFCSPEHMRAPAVVTDPSRGVIDYDSLGRRWLAGESAADLAVEVHRSLNTLRWHFSRRGFRRGRAAPPARPPMRPRAKHRRWRSGDVAGAFTLVRTAPNGTWVAVCRCGVGVKVHPSRVPDKCATCESTRRAATALPHRCRHAACGTTDPARFGPHGKTECRACARRRTRNGLCSCGAILHGREPSRRRCDVCGWRERVRELRAAAPVLLPPPAALATPKPPRVRALSRSESFAATVHAACDRLRAAHVIPTPVLVGAALGAKVSVGLRRAVLLYTHDRRSAAVRRLDNVHRRPQEVKHAQ